MRLPQIADRVHQGRHGGCTNFSSLAVGEGEPEIDVQQGRSIKETSIKETRPVRSLPGGDCVVVWLCG